MFDHRHYVPILKAKQGELFALAEISERAKANLTPLIEAPYIEANEDPAAAVGVSADLIRLPSKLERAWGTNRRFFLDLGLVASDPSLADGVHPVEFILARVADAGMLPVPVIDLRRDDTHRDAVGRIAAAHGRGVCARLDPDDFDDIDSSVAALEAFMDEFGLGRADLDVVLDFGDIEPRQVGSLGLVAHGLVQALPGVTEWRTLTLAATAFPGLRDFGPDTVTPSPRAEWQLWSRLLRRDGIRQPAFADYGIVGTQTGEPGSPQVFAPSPNLRYTTDDEYVIFKARHPRHGFDQFNDLCAALVSRPDYAGPEFSWGDGYINRCAARTDGPGNATKWIQAGTNHHLETVVDQISSLGT